MNTQNEIAIAIHEPQSAGRAARIIKGRAIRYLSGCDNFLIAFFFTCAIYFGDELQTSLFHVPFKIWKYQILFLTSLFCTSLFAGLFWSTYFSSIHSTNCFFCPHFQYFFLTFVATNFIILLIPPPSRYLMVRPINVFYNQ